ncbi:DUF5691 domain-containing protein [Sphingomonas sp.]|uniref:DUF5691 domain-containing protein n=1 Tax=Sphingomonas sp. TaxID=28214 RepID=UPI0025E64037|nr:DUF5691 domain-containing protein [Sphingomonas sp.]
MSAEAIFDSLGPVLTRWTIGGSAVADAPMAWKEALSGDEAELRLLAVAGQFLGVFALPAPPGTLHTLPDLPVLAMPPVPDQLRAITRRCLKALQPGGNQSAFMHLLAARGHTMHPADWIPGRSDDDLPAVYAPLQDWVAGSSARTNADAVLSEATWSDFAPAARGIAFAALRRTDPDSARALLVIKAASEGADVRLRLIAMLATGLSAADIPYLEGLASDRAPKIKACAARLLARLGHGVSDTAEASELVGFFRVEAKGLLRRTRVVLPNPIKTPAQRTRRQELFNRVDYASFARRLGTDDLVAAWPFGDDPQVDAELQAMAVQSASDAVIAEMLARLTSGSTLDLMALQRLRDRLDADQRMSVAKLILRSNHALFSHARLFIDAGADINGLIETHAGSALVAAFVAGSDITAETHALGLIASQAAAQAALDRLTRAGLNPADPGLDLLRLNASLNPTGATA